MHRLKEEDLDKEGQKLAEALHYGIGRLTYVLNQSVGKTPGLPCSQSWGKHVTVSCGALQKWLFLSFVNVTHT